MAVGEPQDTAFNTSRSSVPAKTELGLLHGSSLRIYLGILHRPS
jgi:hypothetical protein